MKRAFSLNTILGLIFGLMLMVPAVCYAGGSSKASVLDIRGEAMFMKAGASVWDRLESTTILKEGDSIKTSPGSEVLLELTGNFKTAELTVKEGTEFKFDTFRFDEAAKSDNTLLNIGVGSILVKAEKLVGDSKFQVKTPVSIVGIRGTIFEVNVPKPKA